jgi:predicted neuraminidase
MPANKVQLIFLLASIVVFGLLGYQWWPQPVAEFTTDSTSIPDNQQPLYHEQFISFPQAEISAVHAASAAMRDDGKILAAWFSGSEEGASDVVIASTVIDPQTHVITPARTIATRLQTETDTWRYIRKLGNPLLHQLSDGRLMLLYVSVSFGGWAASSLNVRFSDDGGQQWTPARRVVTSPFINISTLVKGKPINLSNGDVAVPTYHELMGKFGELLILDPHGRVKNKYRLSWGREAIQPSVVPLSPKEAIALLRDSGEKHKRVAMTRTGDYGKNWAPLAHLELANPNSAVAAMMTTNNRIIMVFNNDEEERNNLSMAVSSDQGQDWKVIHVLEDREPVPGKKIKYSYPYLIRGNNNDYHLFYTWQKERIKYVHFNEAWLVNRL